MSPPSAPRRTTSLCAACLRSVPAELVEQDGQVLMRKRCPAHGEEEVLVSSSAAWYAEAMRWAPALEAPAPPTRAVAAGCPYDCGPCAAHEQAALLPIVPITSACNLDCPICYTHNRNAGAYHMSEAELRQILAHLGARPQAQRIINITGGEPTQHPDFERLLALCQEAGIPRVTLSTHGLRFLKDEALAARLAALDVRVILSFDSLTEQGNEALLGGPLLDAKLRILAALRKHQVPTTLLPVLCKGKNDHELGALLDLALREPFIRSLELHTMTFTGQSGAGFDRGARYDTYQVLRDLERQSAGLLRVGDFVPAPCAHPLCYQVSYLLRLRDGRWLPFTRFMGRADLRDLLAGAVYLSPGPEMERVLQDIITRLWTGELVCDDAEEVLGTLKQVVGEVFAPGLSERQRLQAAESFAKAVYVHAHMDAETFDTDRVRQCCVGIREPDGRNLPSCAYNVLYRGRDARFTDRPAAPLVTLGAGRRATPPR